MRNSPEAVASRLKEAFGDDITGVRLLKRDAGHLENVEQKGLWVTMARRVFHRAVSYLKSHYGQPHICCPMASKEYDDGIELIYPFTLFSGAGYMREFTVTITVFVPKTDLRIRTITDIIPGILFMERETREMLGIWFEDIPDERRLYTPDYLEDDNFPLRDNFNDPHTDAEKIAGGSE